MKKRYMKIIFICLTFLWMAVIFYFSHQTGAKSSNVSGKITETIVNWFVVDFDSLPLNEKDALLETYGYIIRKMGHFTEFAVLSLCLFLAFMTFTDREYVIYPSVLGLSILYAISDEFHQSFISARVPALKDVLIDSFGAMTMLLGIAIFLNLLKLRRAGTEYD